jgi:cell wall-associated NlpC family hydrolase
MTSPAAGNRASQIAAGGLRRVLLALTVTLALLAGSAALSGVQARAAVRAPVVTSSTLGDKVLNKAITRAGHWYSYGAAGPAYFDCSGLVVWAAAQLGVSVPHSTYSMLAGTAHLYRIPLSSIRRGDLVFFGSGHVEINTAWPHTSFGAHHTGTTVGWRAWNGWYAPTMAMRFP